MFHHNNIIKNKYFIHSWKAAHNIDTISDCDGDIKLEKICNELMKSVKRHKRMSIRTSASLIYGTVKMYKKKAHSLFEGKAVVGNKSYAGHRRSSILAQVSDLHKYTGTCVGRNLGCYQNTGQYPDTEELSDLEDTSEQDETEESLTDKRLGFLCQGGVPICAKRLAGNGCAKQQTGLSAAPWERFMSSSGLQWADDEKRQENKSVRNMTKYDMEVQSPISSVTHEDDSNQVCDEYEIDPTLGEHEVNNNSCEHGTVGENNNRNESNHLTDMGWNRSSRIRTPNVDQAFGILIKFDKKTGIPSASISSSFNLYAGK